VSPVLRVRSSVAPWAAGSYLVAAGVILLIATHQAYVPSYAPGVVPLWLNPIPVGGVCALTRSLLLAVMIMQPRWWIYATISMVGGLTLALVALSYAAAGR